MFEGAQKPLLKASDDIEVRIHIYEHTRIIELGF